MKKEDMRVKESISLVDKILVIEAIVSSYFVAGDYTPYYKESATIEAIIRYLIQGIEFENDESPYECYLKDTDLNALVWSFINPYSNNDHSKIMQEILSVVEDKVNLLKEKFSHTSDIYYSIANK